ncbi:MAG: NAD(P)H-binding protein [Saprospiraceae bacterium]
MTNQTKNQSIVMLGATGAVGGEALKKLIANDHFEKITLLGRREVEGISNKNIMQHKADIFDVSSYENVLPNHQVAICTLGVGEPTKVSKADFIKIDKDAVIIFAEACKKAGVEHFSLLSSVGINVNSYNYYMRTKAELVEALKALNFERLSIFQPSMIMTPTNRYGVTQAIALAVWPKLDFILKGKMTQYRGIKVEQLGKAIAMNIYENKTGYEVLKWEDFQQF